MRWVMLFLALGAASCTNSQDTAASPAGLSDNGAGPSPGATAGSSAGGGILGSGTADSPAGAK